MICCILLCKLLYTVYVSTPYSYLLILFVRVYVHACVYVYDRHLGRRSNRSSGSGCGDRERVSGLCSHVRYMGICYILVY